MRRAKMGTPPPPPPLRNGERTGKDKERSPSLFWGQFGVAVSPLFFAAFFSFKKPPPSPYVVWAVVAGCWGGGLGRDSISSLASAPIKCKQALFIFNPKKICCNSLFCCSVSRSLFSSFFFLLFPDIPLHPTPPNPQFSLPGLSDASLRRKRERYFLLLPPPASRNAQE